jgi:outer membrane protein assembly factor BamE (lipoprotein component of BamABCDE complex)
MKLPRRLRRVLYGGLLGLALVSAFLIFGIYRNTTIYAGGYSEKSFLSLRRGVSERDVYNLLGEPLTRDDRPSPETWSYGVIHRQNYFRLAGYATILQFDDRGRVASIHGKGSSNVGKGKAKDEVLRLLGAPQFIVPARASALYYSLPGRSGFYETRIVEIDSSGRVSRLVTYRGHS